MKTISLNKVSSAAIVFDGEFISRDATNECRNFADYVRAAEAAVEAYGYVVPEGFEGDKPMCGFLDKYEAAEWAKEHGLDVIAKLQVPTKKALRQEWRSIREWRGY